MNILLIFKTGQVQGGIWALFAAFLGPFNTYLVVFSTYLCIINKDLIFLIIKKYIYLYLLVLQVDKSKSQQKWIKNLSVNMINFAKVDKGWGGGGRRLSTKNGEFAFFCSNPSLNCHEQYCIILEQEQRKAYKPSLHWGRVHPESASGPVITIKWCQGCLSEAIALFSYQAHIWSRPR